MDAFTIDELTRILKYCPKLHNRGILVFDGWEEWKLHEGDARRIMRPDVKRMECFEFNGEKPKLVVDWHRLMLLDMVFSWGKKASYSH
uniref:Uncharacterized protein n=1 Tax=Lactuca sativa TaxID=4236 RepID=A0A9R1VIE6_LACSA|nr:hypothetical protein LSAT_V11C500255810 [Lactuca sativa]